MNSQKYNPSELNGNMLDAFLERGWFRMGQSVFITHFLRFQEQFYAAVWLRYRLSKSMLGPIEPRLRKIEGRFQVEMKPWLLSDEQEALFTLYRKHSGLLMAESLGQILLDENTRNNFPSLQVSIRHQNRLVGLGIFDVGTLSAAGISNIYHPDYKKFSLGKMLMLLKIRYCIESGFQWFYPGYAVPGYRRFDYKLQVLPEHTQYFHGPEQEWKPYNPAEGLPDVLEEIMVKLTGLKAMFEQRGLAAMLTLYPPFDACLINDRLPEVVTAPAFLMISYQPEPEICTIAVLDVSSRKFCLATCSPLIKNGWNTEGGQLICFDVLQVLKSTGFVFSAEELLKIMTDF